MTQKNQTVTEAIRNHEIAVENDRIIQLFLEGLEYIGIEKTNDIPNILFFDTPRVGNNFSKALVEGDLVEAVIAMPHDIYGSNNVYVIVVCQNKKTDDRKGKVLFINATEACEREYEARGISTFRPQDVENITASYINACEGKEPLDNITYREVTNEEVSQKDYSLFDRDYAE